MFFHFFIFFNGFLRSDTDFSSAKLQFFEYNIKEQGLYFKGEQLLLPAMREGSGGFSTAFGCEV